MTWAEFEQLPEDGMHHEISETQKVQVHGTNDFLPVATLFEEFC